MKKLFAGFLCAATMMSAAAPALATEAPKVISPCPTAAVAQQPLEAQYTLKINDKNVDLGALKIVQIKGKIMVPVRLTSGALGFTVTWDQEKQAIHIDNGKMQADFVLDVDNYCAYSSKAIGMTAPVSLGAAPITIDGFTYVPVDFYKIILTDPNCVSIKDSVITISSDSTKSDNTTQIPNPLVNYNTLDEARNAVGFTFAVPAILPDGYKMEDLIVISSDLAEIFYKNGEKEVLYRTAKGNADISGDYTVYKNVQTVKIGDIEVTVKGNGVSISLATWSKDGVSFSLSFDESVTEKTLSSIIGSIK